MPGHDARSLLENCSPASRDTFASPFELTAYRKYCFPPILFMTVAPEIMYVIQIQHKLMKYKCKKMGILFP